MGDVSNMIYREKESCIVVVEMKKKERENKKQNVQGFVWGF